MDAVVSMRPIGHVESVFKTKNGTPRQSGICRHARAKIRINKCTFNNPDHALENLDEYSHVWILWIFHQNASQAVKAKVSPPRLKGRRVGLFSSRTPHRPNPIGLTLAAVEKVEGDTLYLTGIDMVDGTPVLDIKPFIPLYDNPRVGNDTKQDISCSENISRSGEDDGIDWTNPENRLINLLPQQQEQQVQQHQQQQQQQQQNLHLSDPQQHKHQQECLSQPQPPPGYQSNEIDLIEVSNKIEEDKKDADLDDMARLEESQVHTPGWVGAEEDNLSVSFTSRSLQDLENLSPTCLDLIKDKSQLKSAIEDVLGSDPRSVYRRDRCSDRLYFTSLDTLHVTAWFDQRYDLMEVLALRTLKTKEEFPESL